MNPETNISIFRAPGKCINTKRQMNFFSGSESERKFVNFIQELNTSVIGMQNENTRECSSKSVQVLLGILNQLGIWVREIPPSNYAARFGNIAFRSWFAQLEKSSIGKYFISENFISWSTFWNFVELLSTILPPSIQVYYWEKFFMKWNSWRKQDAKVELIPYFLQRYLFIFY